MPWCTTGNCNCNCNCNCMASVFFVRPESQRLEPLYAQRTALAPITARAALL